MLEASANSPADMMRLEQEIKDTKEEQEQYQQMINLYKEDLQRTSQEQDEGKNETSHVQEGCTFLSVASQLAAA